MEWFKDWFYNPTVKGLLHHAVDSAAAGLVFSIIGMFLKWIFPDPGTIWFIEKTERIVIDALFVIFGLRLLLILLKELWHQIRGGWNGIQVLAG
jgi:hypothetical protein